jgi:DNA mismatch repair protein MutS2
VNGNTFRTLEYEAIRALLAGHAGSAMGRDLVSALRPLTDPARVQAELDLTSEGVTVLERAGRQPYHDLPDVREILPRARVAGLHLEPLELSAVASFAEGAGEIAVRVARVEGAPRLTAEAATLEPQAALAGAIRRAILPSGEVADDASPRLADLRRSLLRARAALHSLMDSYLRDRDTERLLQDKVVTVRNDRYVLVVRSEQRAALPGVVHGGSSSGSSVFVEPLPAVNLNNDIVALQEEERQEVLRVLRDLTARVGSCAEALSRAADVLGRLDFAQARALLAREMAAVPPTLSKDLDLELRQARHPLLMPALAARLGRASREGRDVVPVSLKLGFGAPVLVISGPNTGGKTVALKVLGLFALMAQSGLHVPCAEGSRLPVFQRVFADIGDDQSIAESLSTFSAHLAAIVEMTRDLRRPALVLLDEVGAGTDPTEGGGLGVAVVEHFRKAGAMVAVTTHHGVMKAYAQQTPGVACAAFGYQKGSFAPDYSLHYGTAGRSLALEMAERLGLPAEVVRDARSRLDPKQVQVETLLAKLEAERAALERDRREMDERRKTLRGEEQRLKEREREIALSRKAEADAFARELKKRTEAASAKAQDAIARAVKKLEAQAKATDAARLRARSEALAGIRDAAAEAKSGVIAEPAAPVASAPLAIGGKARLRDLPMTGEVTGFHGDDVDLLVMGKRMRVPRASVIGLTAGGGVPARGSYPHGAAATALMAAAPAADVAEVKVIGLTVDEALPKVDKALDDAALQDRTHLRVVHGMGQGKLKKAVAELLDGHPHVARFEPAPGNQGGAGVTLVELRS